jgi:general secretion pathway protein L
VKTALLIKPAADQQLAWRPLHDGAARIGCAADLAADPTVHEADLVLVVPAQKVLLHSVAFAAHERRLLRQTVPYSLEEELIDDVGEQHFALGAVEGEAVPVAVVQRQWLSEWLARCSAAGLDIKRALPEQLLLPWRPGCWTLLAQAEQWLVRLGPYRGFALEPASAALALQLLLDDAAELPERLLVSTAEPLEQLLPQLPELLRGIVEPLENADPVLPAVGEPALDLLQGAFARTLPWRRWWREWRRPAIALGIALAVQWGVMLVQHFQLQKRNVALRQQIEQIYRGVEPRGVVTEPERQLRRKVEALRGQRGGAVMPLLQQVGSAVTGVAGVKIQNMTYNERQGEIRLSLNAAAFKDVEALRGTIAAKGLNAQLVGSSADGDKTRAQLRITERR